MMRITTQLLREMNACHDQAELFEHLYPDGVDFTPENAQAAYAAGLDVQWLIADTEGRFPLTGTLKRPGEELWYLDGQLHRDDGPAETYHGTEYWRRHGDLHRDDGPAVVGFRYPGCPGIWYLNGEKVDPLTSKP